MIIEVPFFFVDVFASRPLEGNPLALVPDADSLTPGQMRAIAREFNQSETTFLVRPSEPTAAWRLRSYTPAGVEVMGAGHNALGAWLWLAQSGRLPRDTRHFVQQIGAELLAVEVTRDDRGLMVTMDQSAPSFGPTVTDRIGLADALGLRGTDLAEGAAQVVSTGVGHLLVPVADRTVVDRAAPDSRRLSELLRTVTDEGCYVYSLDPGDVAGGSVAYARFFNPTVGIAEDPATGTAAGPLVARLTAEGRIVEGSAVFVEQGHRLGRPSRLCVTVAKDTVRLSGSGVIAGEGTLRVEAAA